MPESYAGPPIGQQRRMAPSPLPRALAAVAVVMVVSRASSAAAPARAAAPTADLWYRHLPNFDIAGNDISYLSGPSTSCAGACDAVPACRAWVHAAGQCWLKSSRAASALVELPRSAKRTSLAALAAPDHPTKVLGSDAEELSAYEREVEGLLLRRDDSGGDGNGGDDARSSLGEIVHHGVVPVLQGGQPAIAYMWCAVVVVLHCVWCWAAAVVVAVLLVRRWWVVWRRRRRRWW